MNHCKKHRKTHCKKLCKCKVSKKIKTYIYDYVIVGGGASGIPLAYLLHEAGEDVILLETGRDEDTNPDIVNPLPLGVPETQFRNEYFWPENGKPNPNMAQDAHYSGGRVLGGGTSVNSYWPVGQHLGNYAAWGGLFANGAYLLKARKSIENFKGVTQDPSKRGHIGPMITTQQPEHPIALKYIEATKNTWLDEYGMNVPIVDDIAVLDKGIGLATRSGYFLDDSVDPNGTRVSTSIGILKNLNSCLPVKTESYVTKIIFDECKKAVGVEYLEKGVCKRIKACKKVIICAGPRSSAILERSGIGNPEILSNYGIQVVHPNSEVGENLENHHDAFLGFSCPPEDNENAVTTKFQNFASLGLIPDPRGPIDFGRFFWSTYNYAPGGSGLFCADINPSSRGYVHISSADPTAPVIVDVKLRTTEEDRETDRVLLRTMVKTLNRMIDDNPGYAADVDLNDATDAELDEYLINNTTHFHQWNGTCQIGKVVDSSFNVMGVQNLMVADSSVFISPHGSGTSLSSILTGVVAYSTITGDLNPKF
jgi:choline dehydrogenase